VFGMDQSKMQGEEVPSPEGLPPDVIISPDARRSERIPPGQSRTRKWPILDASGPPPIDLDTWRFEIGGLTARRARWSWTELLALPMVRVFADFHCVTRWSRLGNLWEGVSTRELVRQVGGVLPEARYVLVHGSDRGWTANLPSEHFLAEDSLVAILHDGKLLSAEHGGPARLIVPRLYAWKSAKWVAGVEFMEKRPAGILGSQRLSYARRSVARGETRLVRGPVAPVPSRAAQFPCCMAPRVVACALFA
jgi:DMSO/TMAO reductase YedYZ molybdopterin-dependent catalytic subunit